MHTPWHTKSVAETFTFLQSAEQGLSPVEAQRRLQKYGYNKLPEKRSDSYGAIFIRQFQSPLIYLLLAASLVVFLMGEVIDGSVIMTVLFFNAFVGSIQEGRAQNTLAALKRFVQTRATVVRAGKELVIEDTAVVPGDLLILQEGEKIAADARVVSSHNLRLDEAPLTGESKPTHKDNPTLKKRALATMEQTNMVFKGTHVVAGNGRAVVVGTGLDTIIGGISKEIGTLDAEIPLKADIRRLSRLIIITVGSICSALFIFGVAIGKSVTDMFTTVVSLSVSIIPEGLPIVMTLVLATGVWRMSKRNALVKRLQAVEALGQARVIAVDKTGTITKNELVVQQVFTDDTLFTVTGIGYEPTGSVGIGRTSINPNRYPALRMLGRIASFCANARVVFSAQDNQWRVAGDPTEAALLVFAKKIGIKKDDLEKKFPQEAEIPFDYKNKFHASLRSQASSRLVAVVGAPEVILENCRTVWHTEARPFLADERKKLHAIFVRMSQTGLRVVACAMRHTTADALTPKDLHALTFLGFLGMKDALRPEVHRAMAQAEAAGIRVVMITGDHKVTAQTIATEAGIFKKGDSLLTGDDIDRLSDRRLITMLPLVTVFARVTPRHKLRIVQLYKKRGEVIAMTGDGVNDAPSLVAADLGVGMGRIGTEVAKEASDIVLLDDNFGSIVAAIEEGRSIYKTMKKVILYLFSTSFGEVSTIAGALVLGFPLPILPAQIIWLNFVTDGFLDVALAMEPKEAGLLKENFKKPKKYLVDALMAQRMVFMAVPMTIGALLLFRLYYPTDLLKGWTVALTVLAVFQWFNAWNCRSEKKSIFQLNPFSNRALIAATLSVIVLQLFAVYHPTLQKILKTTPLAASEWMLIVGVAVSIIFVEEIRKLLYRHLTVAKDK